jgi:hypothetical protein
VEANTPSRPAAIPGDAVWNAEAGEWEVCARGSDGARQGECLMFRADGTLHTRLRYVSGAQVGPFTIYHRDGSVARKGACVAGRVDGLVSSFVGDDEPLRNCCVPAAAVRLDSRYDAGQLVQEVFFDVQGQPLCSDGQPWPPRPAGVPDDAEYHEATTGWSRWRANEQQLWSGAGVLTQEVEFQATSQRTWRAAERTYDESGSLLESCSFAADGRRQGPYRRRLSATTSPYADPRIVEEAGAFQAGQPVGVWQLLDAQGAVVRAVDRGAGGELSASAAVFADDPAATAEDWHARAGRWRDEGRVGEALCAWARAAARAGDPAVLGSALEQLVVPLAPAVALERGDLLVRTPDVTLAQIVDGLLVGADPVSGLRALAAALPGISGAALDLVTAALLLAPDSAPVHLTRALVRFQHGDQAGVESDLKVVEPAAPDAAAALRATMTVTFRPFDFWPARETLQPDATLDDVGAGVGRDLDEVRQVIAVYATRLQAIRSAIQRTPAGAAAPAWVPPDLSPLLAAGVVPLRRETLTAPAEDGGEPMTIEIDETIDTSALNVPSLIGEAQADWAALSWLCWSVGLDQVAMPVAIAERPLVAVAMKTIVTRHWRARDRLTTGGLLAGANGVPGFDWHGIDIDVAPRNVARQITEEYLRVRSMFMWLASADVVSPFQVDLRND